MIALVTGSQGLVGSESVYVFTIRTHFQKSYRFIRFLKILRIPIDS